MDFNYARYMLAEARKDKENPAVDASPSREVDKMLAEALNMNRTRILAYKDKLPTPTKSILCEFSLSSPGQTLKMPPAHCPVAEENGPVTSVKWAPDGRHIAVGLNNSKVQLWDSQSNRLLRTLRDGHGSRVGALYWNNHILTSGGMDGRIINYDVRMRAHIVEMYSGHHREVCRLTWSASGQQLASGGNDNLLHIWDRSMASSNAPTQWLHRLQEHTAAVKGLAWCPWQGNLLASGGGAGDQCIKMSPNCVALMVLLRISSLSGNALPF